MQDHVETKVYRLLAKHFQVEEGAIRAHWLLLEDLSADSEALVELMIQLEETFDREVPDVPLSELTTVGDIVELVRQAVAERPATEMADPS